MKVAVTGAGGFLGQRLLPQLVSHRHDVEVVAFSSQDPDTLYSHDRIEYHDRKSATDEETMSGNEVLVHCAFPRATDGEALAMGLAYNRDVFKAAVHARVTSIVNISSQSVYAINRATAATEDTVVVPAGPYGLAKYASEMMVQSLPEPIKTVSLRVANLVGPGFNQRVLNKMADNALNNGHIEVTSPDTVVDLMDARDAALAVVSIIGSRAWEAHDVINVGSGVPTSLETLAALVGAIVKQQTGHEVTVSTTARNPGSNSSMGIQRLRSTTGFEARYSMKATASDIVNDLWGRQKSE
ncbi:NAD(P)-dependent oxidoreductase [Brevibacterium luteolum]|nr:NAD(P)-dependent oxidoreductase [Brevibacterium luteolum]